MGLSFGSLGTLRRVLIIGILKKSSSEGDKDTQKSQGLAAGAFRLEEDG